LPPPPDSTIFRRLNLQRASRLVLNWVLTVVPAVAGANDETPPPLHPTAIVCEYKGRSCQVIGVRGSYGVIEDEGKPVRLMTAISYDAARATAYVPGGIALTHEKAQATEVQLRVAGLVDSHPENSDYDATAVASRTYADCYLVILFYDQAFANGTTDDPAATFAFQEVGTLQAGVETKVKAVFHYVDPHRQHMVYLPLYFSHGAEIRTNHADEVAAIFRRIEMIRHRKLVDLYLGRYPQATRAAEPYLRIPPIFPEEVGLAKLPTALKVDFAVISDGTVDGVFLPAGIPPEVALGVRRAMRGWLYLPKLESGRPVDVVNSIELNFQGPGNAAHAAGAR
jgi:hypothetical protein